MAAGDAVVKGTSGFTEQPRRRRWINGRGWVTVRTYEGALNDTNIDALVATLQAADYEEIEVTRAWPTVITAQLPDPYDPTDSNADGSSRSEEWELVPFVLDKALGTHGKFQGSGMVPETLAAIDADLRAGTAYGKDYDTIYGAGFNFQNYSKLRSLGVDTWRTFGFTLRMVKTYERNSGYVRDYQQAAVNQGKVIAWDKIGVPDTAKIERPWVRLYVGAGEGVPAAAFRPGFAAAAWAELWINEWLVHPPAIRFGKQGRVKTRQITQEWAGAVQWSSVLYDGGTHTP